MNMNSLRHICLQLDLIYCVFKHRLRNVSTGHSEVQDGLIHAKLHE